jgi:hypothetical protein
VLANGDTIPYALALVHGDQSGLRTISHGGSSLGFRAHYLRFPDQHVAVIVLCNTPANPARLAAQVATLYLGDQMRPSNVAVATTQQGAGEPKEISLGASELQRFAGEYRSDELDATFRIVATDGRLVIRRTSAADVPLIPIGSDRFRSALGTLEFTNDATGEREFRLQGGRMKNLLFHRTLTHR